MISAIIPSYRNPAYLDLCLRSATEGKVLKETEIIVVLDGYAEESMHVVEKYGGVSVISLEANKGMAYAINLGVMNATNPYVFIVNDDNVFPLDWDSRIYATENRVVTVNQVEPEPGIFNFVVQDFGRTPSNFRLDEWKDYELTISEPKVTEDGRLFPFVISKKWFMTVGGFDTFYQSPFWVDVDFWLKLELTKQLNFTRKHGMHLYHFGGRATKGRNDAEANTFQRSEQYAAQQFLYKWGYLPDVVKNAQLHNNSKLPLDSEIKGIKFH